MSNAQCYVCGAKPGHHNKSLDVYKLFECSECGTIACVKHRKGLVGGECVKCGSTRSTIIHRKGKFGSGGVAGAGTAAAPADAGGERNIGTGHLKQMQESRIEAEQAVAQRRAEAIAAAQAEMRSIEDQKKADEAEAAVQSLLGDKSLVMSAVAEDLISKINSKLPEGVSLASLKKDIDDANMGINNDGTCSLIDKAKEKTADAKSHNAKMMISEAMAEANIADEISALMAKNILSKSVFELGEDSSLVGVSADSAVPVSFLSNKKSKGKKKDGIQEDEEDEIILPHDMAPIAVGQKIHSLRLLDSFCVKDGKSLSLDEVILQKTSSEENIAKFLDDNFDFEGATLDLKLRVNNFIPLDYIDHLLNLNPKDLEDSCVDIITGIISQNLSFETEAYLEQFALLLPKKSYIKGIYASFAINDDYTLEQQRGINLKLLDMAQENGKSVYLGKSGCSISHWKSIFDEYDLSEIKFVYTDIITSTEELDFIKENNIQILIRPDVDFAYYAEMIKDYPNFCFGSAFVKSAGDDATQEQKNSGILTKILKNMDDIDKKFIEKLLNI